MDAFARTSGATGGQKRIHRRQQIEVKTAELHRSEYIQRAAILTGPLMAIRFSAVRRPVMRLALTVLATGFVLFVWPTRYRHDRLQMLGETAPGPVYPVRIDRFTGEAQILLPQMLLDARHNMQLAWVGGTGEPLPAEAIAALRGSVLIDTAPLPFAQILNTTEWRLTKLRWAIRNAAESNTEGGPTLRLLDQTVFIEPHSVASLYLDLGRFGHDAAIVFDSAWGVRPTAY
jgi:hypothetical protein